MFPESLPIIPVECVKCGHEVKTNLDDVRERKLLNCSNCHAAFHIFDVIDMYYDQEPLIQRAINLIINPAMQPYQITGDEEYVANVKNVLSNVKFDSLLKTIFTDVVKYGDSFLEIIKKPESREIIGLKPLSSKAVKAVLGKEIQHGGRGFTGEREIQNYIVTAAKEERKLAPSYIVHSRAHESHYYGPYGKPAMRTSLKNIYHWKKNRVNAARQGAAWWVNKLESEIVQGIGVPPIFLLDGYGKLDTTIVDMASTWFISSVKHAQRAVEEGLRKDLFTQVVNSEDYRQTPHLEFTEPSRTQILKNGGYDFSAEIKKLEMAKKLGIITEEEYKRNLLNYFK